MSRRHIKDKNHKVTKLGAKWNTYFEETSGKIEEKYTNRLNLKADLIDGIIPASQLPSCVDDVIEGTVSDDLSTFFDADGIPVPLEVGKIYIDLMTNKTYG